MVWSFTSLMRQRSIVCSDPVPIYINICMCCCVHIYIYICIIVNERERETCVGNVEIKEERI